MTILKSGKAKRINWCENVEISSKKTHGRLCCVLSDGLLIYVSQTALFWGPQSATQNINLIFVVPSIMLYSSEISPTRRNNCVFILRNGFTLHVFRQLSVKLHFLYSPEFLKNLFYCCRQIQINNSIRWIIFSRILYCTSVIGSYK